MSTKKLRPIIYGSKSTDKRKVKAQSLNFNSSLSYVMIKGKVEASESYIYKNMLPYTNAQ